LDEREWADDDDDDDDDDNDDDDKDAGAQVKYVSGWRDRG